MTTAASLGWRDDWATKVFEIALDAEEDNIIRARLAIERGIVIRFAVQYEARFGGRPRAVVRWDSAHDRPHRDLLDPTGRVIAKRWIDGRAHNQVVTDAIEEIKRDWRAYRAAFARMMT